MARALCFDASKLNSDASAWCAARRGWRAPSERAILHAVRIGPYETEGELGRGGIGVVYRARSPQGEAVALKVLIARADDERAARFERERRLLGSFTARDGFVPLIDAGVSEHGPYLVMPLVPGGTLADRLRRGPLGVDETLAIGRALCDALGRAHERGVVHRDLKPANVLFTAEGTPLVADLGLAKHFDASAPGASQSASVSRSGALRGTPGYMAPEQVTDAKSAGPAVDVFALGAILYECLTGRPPFEDESFVRLIARIVAGEREPLRRARPDVPAWLASVVEKALATDPAARFRDALALRRALEAPPVGRRRALVALLAVAAVLGAACLLAVRADGRDPARVAALLAKGDEKYYRDDYDGALADYALAAELDPRNAVAWDFLSCAKGRKGEKQAALDDAARAVTLDPKNAHAWTTYGAAKDDVGDATGARAAFDRALELDPKLPIAWTTRGQHRLHRGDVDGAIADFTREIELAPKQARGWGSRGSAREQRGDLSGALADLDKALELDSSRPEYLLARCSCRVKTGDKDGAFADADRAVQLAPKDPGAWAHRGNARANRGDTAGAISDFSESLRLDPKSANTLELRGMARAARGETDRALEDLDRAIDIEPRTARHYANRAVVKIRRGDFDAAIADSDKAIDIDGTVATSWLNRAVAKREKGDFEGVIADCSQAIELDPKLAAAWGNRGGAKRRLRRRDEALADFEKFLELAPDDPEAAQIRQWVEERRAKR